MGINGALFRLFHAIQALPFIRGKPEALADLLRLCRNVFVALLVEKTDSPLNIACKNRQFDTKRQARPHRTHQLTEGHVQILGTDRPAQPVEGHVDRESHRGELRGRLPFGGLHYTNKSQLVMRG